MRWRHRNVLILLTLGGGVLTWLFLQFLLPWLNPDELRLAQQFLAKRDFDSASRQLAAYLKKHPEDAKIRLLAARTARRERDYETARAYREELASVSSLADAVKLEDRLQRLQEGNLAEVDALLATAQSGDQREESLLILEALIEGHLKAVGPAVGLGATRANGAAVPDLERGLRIVNLWLARHPRGPERARGLVWRSVLYEYAFDQKRAAADLREALRENPEDVPARLHLAQMLALESPEEATAHLKTLRRIAPENRDVLFAMAALQRSLGRLDEARDLLNELLATDASDVSCLIERGYVALNEGRPEEAAPFVQKAYQLAPEEPEANLLMGGWLTMIGRSADAKTFEERAIQIGNQRREQARAALQEEARKRGAATP